METKTCTMCNIEKKSKIFTKNVQSVKVGIVLEDWSDIMKIKIKYQINKNFIMKEIEKKYYYRNKTIDAYNLEN